MKYTGSDPWPYIGSIVVRIYVSAEEWRKICGPYNTPGKESMVCIDWFGREPVDHMKDGKEYMIIFLFDDPIEATEAMLFKLKWK